MKVHSYNNKHTKRYVVYPFDDSTNCRIDVNKSKGFAVPTWNEADINWVAIGSTTPEKTEQFANALLRAVQIARELNTGIEPKVDVAY